MAAPRPTIPAMSGVPASNLNGISFQVVPVEADPLDHVAAALVGRHRLQMLGLAVQHAHAGGAVELVAGEDEEVGVQLLHVDRDVLAPPGPRRSGSARRARGRSATSSCTGLTVPSTLETQATAIIRVRA